MSRTEALALLKAQANLPKNVTGPQTTDTSSVPSAAASATVGRLPVLEPRRVLDSVVEVLCRNLHVTRADLALDDDFKSLGVDSVGAVEIVRDVNKQFGLRLEAVALFDHPTPVRLAQLVVKESERFRATVDAARGVEMVAARPGRNESADSSVRDIVMTEERLLASRSDSDCCGLSESEGTESTTASAIAMAGAAESLPRHSDMELNVASSRKISASDGVSASGTRGSVADYGSPLSEGGEQVGAEVAFGSAVAAPRKLVLKTILATSSSATPPLGLRAGTKAERGNIASSTSEIAARAQDIAIIGLSCRLPGARNAAELWGMLRDGKDAITEIPADRWDVAAVYDPKPNSPYKTVSKWGGLLEEVDKFDPQLFNISPLEAERMDPQQRLFLEESWAALEDAGYSDVALVGKKCGVFVGVSQGDYLQKEILPTVGYLGHVFTGFHSSILAARISYLLDLKGPSLAIDTACSSSLVAIHQACQSIAMGDCELALAGGVSLLLSPHMHILTSQAGMLSPSGRCRTFDGSADGIVLGEGVGVVLLKPVERAVADGDHIYGVIKASGINQDGKTNGITAPSAEAQAQLERDVYARAGIEPESISYVEAHGTGTLLGDPIEVRALRESFGNIEKAEFCALGSIKANIGHTTMAAGVASLIKVLLMMKHREIPPVAQYKTENTLLGLAGSPFYVPTVRQPWQGEIRRAAVSSFGFSGTNCHMVIEEWVPAGRAAQQDVAWPFTLSAKSEDALRGRVAALRDWVLDDSGTPLRDIAYTLLEGRSHFDFRLAFVAAGKPALEQELDRIARGGLSAAPFYARVPYDVLAMAPSARDEFIVGPLEREANLRELCKLYVEGYRPNGACLFDNAQRVALPTYPFARERYWISSSPKPREIQKSAFLHPLVHRNSSTLEGQRFTSQLAADQFYLADHRVGEACVLPGVAYLEMIRAAAANSTEGTVLGLRSVLWSRPLVVGDDPVEVQILLESQGADVRVEVTSGNTGPVLLASAVVLVGEKGEESIAVDRVDIEAIRVRCAEKSRGDELYRLLEAKGLRLGGAFQGITMLCRSATEALATVRLPEACRREFESYELHPGLLDAVFQGVVFLMANGDTIEPHLPFALEEIAWTAPLPELMHVHIVAVGGADGISRFDVTAIDDDGCVRVRARDFAVRGLVSLSSSSGDSESSRVVASLPVGIVAARSSDAEDVAAFRAAKDDQRVEAISEQLVQIVAELLKLDRRRVSPERDMGEYGFDSITLTELSGQLNRKFGAELTPAVMFEHRTLRSLARSLSIEHGVRVANEGIEAVARPIASRAPDAWEVPEPGPRDPALPSLVTPSNANASRGQRRTTRHVAAGGGTDEPIAIVGIAGVLPQSDDLEEFWGHLRAGDDLMTEIPASRWDWHEYWGDPATEPHRTNIKWGAFMRSVENFDAAFFGIARREAELMDPQQRVFLQTVWHAIEDAGHRASTLAGSKTGLFVGVSASDYSYLLRDRGIPADAYTSTGLSNTVLANRVSFLLDLRGPSEPVDTACSSSLVAIHRAVESIRAGDCDMAIAGGVNVIVQPTLHISFSKAGMLSPDGRCKTFDKSANGYGRGEGTGAVFLKPVSKALADGDHVYAVIKGTAVNHGGRTNSLTVPSPSAQAAVIVEAWRKARVDPATVGYIEAHGTGTPLGDPVEVNGLKKAFEQLYQDWNHPSPDNPHCALGSVKSNVGHLETAAGIAGVLKVVLAMRAGELPPTLHVKESNPYIKLEESPFFLATKLAPWPRLTEVDGRNAPLRAGVSSFGFGGANAHVALEEFVVTTPSDVALSRPELVVLSAKTEERLRAQAAAVAKVIGLSGPAVRDVAYTSWVGREAMEARLAVIATDVDELAVKLDAFARGQVSGDVFVGNSQTEGGGTEMLLEGESGRELLRIATSRRELDKLARLWVTGINVDGAGLSAGRQRIALPGYPFQPKRYWVPQLALPASGVEAKCATLHPLVHRNVSTFEAQRYATQLSGREFFLADHRVGNRSVLPGVAILEMARAAAELASLSEVCAIEQVVWTRPLVVGEDGESVVIELHPQDGVFGFVVAPPDRLDLPYARGRVALRLPGETAVNVNVAGVLQRCSESLDAEDFYSLFAERGLLLGSAMRSVVRVSWMRGEALAVLRLPAVDELERPAFVLNPALIDGAFQTVMALLARDGTGGNRAYLPFELEAIQWSGSLSGAAFAHAIEREANGSRRRFDISVLSSSGAELATIRGLTMGSLDMPRDPPAIVPRSPWTYVPEWQLAPRLERGCAAGPVLLFGDGATKRALEDAVGPSHPIVLVERGERFSAGGTAFVLRSNQIDDYRSMWKHLASSGTIPGKAIVAWRGDNTAERLDVGVHAIHALVRSWMEQSSSAALVLLVPVAQERNQAAPEQIALAAWLGSVGLERSTFSGKVVYGAAGRWAELFRNEWDASGLEIAYRGSQRFERRWIYSALHADNALELSVDGVHLITGGVGGLGLLVAEYLAQRGPARIVLVGRSELNSAQKARIFAIARLGATVHYERADVSERAAAFRIASEVRRRFGAIQGVWHLAGSRRDAYLVNKERSDVEAVLAPKVWGISWLDEATTEDSLEVFVAFSSVAALRGNAGQADYAYANAFLEAFAEQREGRRYAGTRRGRTLSIAWSLWKEGGMGVDEPTQALLRGAVGMTPIRTAEGLQSLSAAICSPHPCVLVIEGDREKLERALCLGTGHGSAPTRALDGLRPQLSSARPTSNAGLLNLDAVDRSRPEALDQPRNQYPVVSSALIESQLVAHAMRILKLEEDEVPPTRELPKWGFDSITLTELASAVNQALGLDLTPTVFFEHQTIDALVAHIQVVGGERLRESAGVLATEAASVSAPTPQPVAPRLGANYRLGKDRAKISGGRAHLRGAIANAPSDDEPIAIVGIAGVMPQSRDLREFWQHLERGEDLITEIPEDRWDWRAFYGDPAVDGNKTNVKYGAFMFDVDKFDASFFGISPREAELMDPQQRIFLEVVWKALEDSGHAPSEFSGSRTGLFVGVAGSDYTELLRERDVAIQPYTATGLAHSVLANRISFLLNLRGPSEPVDTACSSSLVAVHRAVQAIRSGDCEMAIAGGVNVIVRPSLHIAFNKAGMLSADGRCKAFGKGGNGYARGEGAGAVLLKPLNKALLDGDRVYAIVRATAVNHGGQANSLTAPNPNAQAELMVDAYRKSGIDPSTVTCLEAHGTGTALGDPVETSGMKMAFERLYADWNLEAPASPHCAIGSVKTNVGHLETAAGIASLLKVVLSMVHGRIPASLHAQELNPFLRLEGSPFFVASETRDWNRLPCADGGEVPRRAGISSFGFGGANAHIVLEEYPPRSESKSVSEHARESELLVLSAQTRERLKAYARQLANYLSSARPELSAVAHTLRVGRNAMKCRVAFVASDLEDAIKRFKRFSDGDDEGCFVGLVKTSKATSLSVEGIAVAAGAGLLARSDLASLAERWVGGAPSDWSELTLGQSVRRMSLPTYPFDRQRHWVDSFEATATPANNEKRPVSEKEQGEPLSAPTTIAEFAAYEGAEVVLSILDGGIALVEMNDERNRNMFNESLIRGLVGRFAQIAQRKDVKAVVVTGRGRVFSMGGSWEALVSISEQRTQFTDIPFLYRGLLDCSVPVVAAIQGHASGGGFVFGLYADIVVMAEEGVYGANFVKYGFTPGMGATWILKERLGGNIATEMMFTAKPFSGEELRERGASVIVCPSGDVVAHSVGIARTLANLPSAALRELKSELSRRALEAMGPIIASETAMHERTFANPEVRERIERQFAATWKASTQSSAPLDGMGAVVVATDLVPRKVRLASLAESAGLSSAPLQQTKAHRAAVALVPTERRSAVCNPEAARRQTAVASAHTWTEEAVQAKLVAIIGNVLHISADAVSVDESVRDMGADSIGAVEIVRDVNKSFQLNLEAVTMYDYATIRKLAGHIVQVAGEIDGVRQSIGSETPNAESPAVVGDVSSWPAAASDATAASVQVGLPKVALSVLRTGNPASENDRETVQSAALTSRSVPLERAVVRGETPSSSGNCGGDLTWSEQEVQAKLVSIVGSVLHFPCEAIDVDESVRDLGADSIGAVEIVRDVNKTFELSLEAVTMYDHATIRKLGSHIVEALREREQMRRTLGPSAGAALTEVASRGGSPIAGPVEGVSKVPAQFSEASVVPLRWANAVVGVAPQAEVAEKQKSEVAAEAVSRVELNAIPAPPLASGRDLGAGTREVAIVGMSGRFPGARNVNQLWESIRQGKDCIVEIPADRWDSNQYYDPRPGMANKTCSKWGGFVQDVDRFDPLFFSISPREAELMDPQQRLFLEEAWNAIEDAGYAARDLSEKRCGVFVGAAAGDYAHSPVAGAPQRDAPSLIGLSPAILAARMSYFLNLAGPSVAIDTACSSSLVAIHQGAQSLLSGECDMVLAGGVALMLSPGFHVMTSRAGMLSPTGRCRPFDSRADGIVVSEGVGVVLLKRLADAIADGDSIHGVIKASALNQDGKTNGITAPSATSQARLEREVYQRAELTPESISYVEAHGTGTSLGDPIEVRALKQVYGGSRDKRSCALGSIKASIGHTTMAAGVASVIKVLLMMRHREIPPVAHFRVANDLLGIDDSPFYVPTQVEPWQGAKLRAAVSSFGFSGTNAHLVLEEAPSRLRLPETHRSQLIVLSAKSDEALSERIEALAAFIRADGRSLALDDIALTLLLGRTGHPVRIAFVAESRESLLEHLDAVARSDQSVWAARADLRQTAANHDVASKALGIRTLEALATESSEGRSKHLRQLAQLFAKGCELEWSAVFVGARKPLRVSLPGYPFARERYWLAPAASVEESHALDALHPLLHQNVSDARGLRFASYFGGREYMFSDHVIGGQPLLPGSAYLEMAQAAAELVSGREVSSLCGVNWAKPILANEHRIEVETKISVHAGGAEVTVESDGIHASVRVSFGQRPSSEDRLDIAALKARLPPEIDGKSCYEAFATKGFVYGPAFQAIAALQASESEVLARIELPEKLHEGASKFSLHPVLLDASFQSVMALIAGSSTDDGSVFLPFALEEVATFRPLPLVGYVYATPSGSHAEEARVRRFDIQIVDEAGRLCVSVGRFAIASRSRGARSRAMANDVLLLRSVWTERNAANITPSAIVGSVLIISSEPSCREAIASALANRGVRPEALWTATVSERFELRGERSIALDVNDWASFERLLGEMRENGGLPTGIFFVLPTDQIMCAEPIDVPVAITALATAVIRSRPTGRTTLVVAQDGEAVELDAVGALLRTASSECPDLVGRIVRASGATAVELGAFAVGAIEAEEDEVRYIAGRRMVRVWNEFSGAPLSTKPVALTGVHLVSGGAGGLGFAVAEYLAQAGAEAIVLAGRSNLSSSKVARIAAIERLGATVVYERGDVGVRGDAERMVGVARGLGRIRGVWHLAGVRRDAFLINKTRAQVEEVVSGKVQGAKNLDELTAREPLEHFVMFSSVAGVGGNAGQADYAYANAFLDAFAEQRTIRRARGECVGRTISVAWPLWKEGGMEVQASTLAWLEEVHGLKPLTTPQAMRVLDTVIATELSQVLVLSGDPTKLRRRFVSPQPSRTVASPDATGLLMTASSADWVGNEALMREQAERYFAELLAGALKLPPTRIRPHEPLEAYGIDSVMVMDLNRELEQAFGPLSKTLFFEYQTVSELAGYFVSRHPQILAAKLHGAGAKLTSAAATVSAVESQPAVGASTATAVKADEGLLSGVDKATNGASVALSASESRARSSSLGDANSLREGVQNRASQDEAIAIVGISGSYPGATDLDALWGLLRSGKDSIREIPESRWSHDEFFDERKDVVGKTYSKWGGFLDDVEMFDPLFFNISPREAEMMDPQERLFMQTVWHTLEDAGYTRSSLRGSSTAVYVGVMYGQYQLLGADTARMAEGIFAGSSYASIANRVSYFFDFVGPSLAIDSMCSSSLTAIHLACESLRREECSIAIAGGVNVAVHPSKYLQLAQARFASSDGRCRSFGEGGDGYVPGEGVGAVMLKPLSRAIADGDRIHAVIRGTAMNHGGKTNGYTVPNPRAQAVVVAKAMARSGVLPREIGYVEAHGTGTPLGDPIEISGLMAAYGGDGIEPRSIPIGSIKSNVGHLESAAGIAGLTKVVLQMKYGEIVPSLHSAKLNPNIDFDSTPFIVPQSVMPWRRRLKAGGDVPRRAGLSSFGAGGSNAHLVLEEYIASSKAKGLGSSAPQVLVLSALSEESLRVSATRLADFLLDSSERLEDIAYTLQRGRESFGERLAFVTNDLGEARELLLKYGRTGEAGRAFRESVTNRGSRNLLDGEVGRTFVESLTRTGEMAKVAQLWACGEQIDWTSLHSSDRPSVIAVPQYPFARVRCWVGEPRLGTPSSVAMGLHSPAVTEVSIEPAKPQRHVAVSYAPVERDSSKRSDGGPVAIRREVARIFAETLKLEADTVDVDRNMTDYGLESVTWLQLLNRVNAHFRLTLQADQVMVANVRTISEFSGLLADRLKLNAAEASVAPVNGVEAMSESEVDDALMALAKAGVSQKVTEPTDVERMSEIEVDRLLSNWLKRREPSNGGGMVVE